jgi:ABC-2 type transport system ATP-binding protein
MPIAISLKNLRKTYGDKTALDDISLDIPEGTVTGYIGPNGAGKSTTVKILTGLITDFGGTATVLGLDLNEQLLDIKAQIGYIPENAALYEQLTPMEYLHFVGGLYRMEAGRIEERARKIMHIFELDDVLDQRIDSFSKGMRQKVLITSALIHDPKIIYMDEPLSGLDANAVILIKDLIQELKQQGKTILYCSHIMDVVEKVSDRIVLLNEGKIIAQGTMEELQALAESGSLESIFSKLTGNTEGHNKVSDFLSIFKS